MYTGDFNTGDYNKGIRNTGSWNPGDYNAGGSNAGHWNTGDYNAGDFNTGNRNKGNHNTGDYNKGIRNTGSRNTGERNTGDRNKGSHNTGNRNTGNRNTGLCNTGDWNTGHWNACNHSAGFFNTVEQKVPVFNGARWVDRVEFIKSPAYQALFSVGFKLTEWVSERACTDLERGFHNYIKGEGVLVSRTFKEACSLWWRELTDENKALIPTMEGFDADVFHEITGIDVGRKSSENQTLKQAMQTLKQENQALLERISKLESEAE